MTYYMDQDLFNATVLTLALAEHVSAVDPIETEAVRRQLLRAYTEFYAEDDFAPEAEDCAARTLVWIGDTISDPAMQIAWLSELIRAVQKYYPDGEKKPWRLFNGLKFTSARHPILDRRQRYFKDLKLYYLNIQIGRIHT